MSRQNTTFTCKVGETGVGETGVGKTFTDLLYILHSEPSLEHLATKLEEKYSK